MRAPDWRLSRRGFLACGAAAALGCSRDPDRLVVFAAASVEEALRAIVARQKPGPSEPGVKLSFAASSVLAQQIAATRAADVFLSADEQWMQWVEDRGLIEPGTRRALLGNGLVIVARDDSKLQIARPEDLVTAEFDRFVIADPQGVPAGRYARAFLEGQQHQGRSLWQVVSPRLAPQLDARATVAAVLADPRRVGIVYASDLTNAKRLRALYRVPPDAAPRIVYPIGVIAGRPRIPAARAWVDGLSGGAARATFEQFGFRALQ